MPVPSGNDPHDANLSLFCPFPHAPVVCDQIAAFYSADGSLAVNDGAPATIHMTLPVPILPFSARTRGLRTGKIAEPVQKYHLLDFAERYTAAWCSQDAVSVAAFYSADGSLAVNDAAPAVGRVAIAEVAQSFMTAFPDLRVTLDAVTTQDGRARYHWTLTGTNTGPGGTGRPVRISGFEIWRFGDDGLIASSQGHFDSTEYRRQLAQSV